MKLRIPANLPVIFIRLGLALFFLYTAISSFISPLDWVDYLPNTLMQHADSTVMTKAFSIHSLALAAWLLSGAYLRYAALLSVLTLALLILSNLNTPSTVFRDMTILLTALSLVVMPEKR
ncbi:MAG TPA: hypothetical protein VLA92_01580 [Candidatus Saccharimonadales bacterium]|nr:hypothetical protein [Candidatus Saccharimonadales bacterium]